MARVVGAFATSHILFNPDGVEERAQRVLDGIDQRALYILPNADGLFAGVRARFAAVLAAGPKS